MHEHHHESRPAAVAETSHFDKTLTPGCAKTPHIAIRCPDVVRRPKAISVHELEGSMRQLDGRASDELRHKKAPGVAGA